MNCPSCGAPLRMADNNASLRCDYCKSVTIAQADETGVEFVDEAAELACPNCATPLWSAMLAGSRLYACKQCHGLLVEMGTFEALIERMRAEHPETKIPMAPDAADLERKVECPKCHKRMDTHYYFGGGHAVMSSCERCELHWLDGGMLMQVVRAPHEGEEATGF
ncbi:MAG: zf-TFIIB domain-containing protein [Terracidiphilus sp.]